MANPVTWFHFYFFPFLKHVSTVVLYHLFSYGKLSQSGLGSMTLSVTQRFISAVVLSTELEKRPLDAVSRTLLAEGFICLCTQTGASSQARCVRASPSRHSKPTTWPVSPTATTAAPTVQCILQHGVLHIEDTQQMLSDLSQGQQASACSLLWGVGGIGGTGENETLHLSGFIAGCRCEPSLKTTLRCSSRIRRLTLVDCIRLWV